MVIAGYTITGEPEDGDFNISIFADNPQGQTKLLYTINPYGAVRKPQKGIHLAENRLSFTYGDLPEIKILDYDDYYLISIGFISLKVKKAQE